VDLRGHGTDSTSANPCNRQCLTGLVEKVLEAMLAHNAQRLPLAKGVRYSENGQFVAIGDGLWGTAGKIGMPGKDDYAAYFADPESGTGAYWGLTNEHGTTGVLALRLKAVGGKIGEIEAIDVRTEFQGPRGGTVTLMRPPLPVEFKGDSINSLDPAFLREQAGRVDLHLITAYLDGLERHSAKDVKFTPDCSRRDNTLRETGGCAAPMAGIYNHTTKVRDRRILVADRERGVVMAVAMADNPGAGPANLPASQLVPSTYMVPLLIKVDNGAISRVEDMVKWMPFGYTSAWAELRK
jgi:hypothetical protein